MRGHGLKGFLITGLVASGAAAAIWGAYAVGFTNDNNYPWVGSI